MARGDQSMAMREKKVIAGITHEVSKPLTLFEFLEKRVKELEAELEKYKSIGLTPEQINMMLRAVKTLIGVNGGDKNAI